MPLSVLACIPDLPETELDAQKSSNLHITTEPLDLHQVAADCSLMISQGGTNAGTLMLLSGVPVLVCPLELEQTLWAYRITAQGLGSMINLFNPNPDFKAKIEYNINSTEIIDQVHKFAQHYTDYDGKQTVHDIAKRITMTVTT
jgi:UDP:flavonoid glycosyltransferase YjiC (YdhE family)